MIIFQRNRFNDRSTRSKTFDGQYNEKFMTKQRIEIGKVCYHELKMYDFLQYSLSTLQQNMRNVIQLWAKNLAIDTDLEYE